MPKRISNEERERLTDIAERMYLEDEQITLKQIGQRLGISTATVWRWLKRRGVPMRPPPSYYRLEREKVIPYRQPKPAQPLATLEAWDLEAEIDQI